MKIVVLVKEVPDTYEPRRLDLATGLLDRAASDAVVDEINERALEVALQVKDSAKDTEIVAIAMGPAEAKDGLKKALQMGADRAVHILDDALAGSDALATARVLAAAVAREQPHLVLAGNESTDGRGGIVPAMIAELLGLPLAGSLGSVEIDENAIRGTRTTDVEITTVAAALPAVVTVTEKSAEARFPSFKGVMAAKKKPTDVVTASVLGVARPEARTVMRTTAERPARAAGTTIEDDGSGGTQLAEWLLARGLVVK
ncbi:MAG TPA: electron transfer flavoprotein subunit beta/FixA family protein [Microbacteriaceae bacterium]|nr:electron transfer flavoprotein subunit beta/FixA family protein [Microbacteriaceae bacterium]